ncbi:MAG TPA: kelch repeat-containing protein [Nitrospinota bacterium]|nr:kelch repeat-containing protein [Nitrospinota bacterium]
MPTARDHLAVAVAGDTIFAVGGRLKSSYAKNLDTNETYDIKKDKWIKKPPLPTPRSGIAAATLRGKIFVFGGEAPKGTFNLNEAYDPRTEQWTTMTSMPTSRHGLGATVIGDSIYVIGGGPKPGGSYSNINEVFTLKQ